MPNENLKNFKFVQSRSELYRRQKNGKLFNKVTKNSLKLFFLAGDEISTNPMIGGAHEAHIKSLLSYFSKNGYSDFLIDIGANIGLTSCQSGDNFKIIHLFEPNPDCVNILRVNTKLSLKQGAYTIHDFGLGAENKIAILNVPIGNLGGAFVRDDFNSYSDDVLAMKDRQVSIHSKNYDRQSIQVRKGREVLGPIFSNLISNNLCSGVIKIDVEGYELTVLRELAASIPIGMQCAIIFECWDENFQQTVIEDIFKQPLLVYKLINSKKYSGLLHKLVSKWSSKFCHSNLYSLKPLGNYNPIGDLVFLISKF